MSIRLLTRARNLIYKNRLVIKAGNHLRLPFSTERAMKRVTLKLGGKNNRIVFGEHVLIGDCEIRLDGDNNLIEVGDHVRFKFGKIYLRHTSGQHIRIGAGTTVEGAYLLVDEAASITIGADCMFSTDINIRTGDKHSILDADTGERINVAQDINIADRVWLGRSVQVLKGTVLRSETVVGTCSLVSGSFDEGNCVLAGVPARIVRRGIRWDRELL
ncbi:acyltransferase [Ectopseudomonas alcaliphila]|uniref:acyltransferase n=1 Tax=Ectopseudomonas alcaliphila TaxID=101564 RepID=UPI00278AA9C8|nr:MULTISPECIES: hypothetical protein [Pseudomonas]MDP9938456.1 acetyltransferase-like isoleucine patch superfamily enzyme [Pseudomonas sp. 3400]MDR7010679.1 acetyltransferase-like isoleucine patch superfamily enzyme [Pseudomonas alcaliphila]